MDYSTDSIQKIEKYAKSLMTPSEISFLLDIDETVLLDDINTLGNPARRAFMKGAATIALSIREGIIDSAAAGSPFSIAECQKLLDNIMSNVRI